MFVILWQEHGNWHDLHLLIPAWFLTVGLVGVMPRFTFNLAQPIFLNSSCWIITETEYAMLHQNFILNRFWKPWDFRIQDFYLNVCLVWKESLYKSWWVYVGLKKTVVSSPFSFSGSLNMANSDKLIFCLFIVALNQIIQNIQESIKSLFSMWPHRKYII